MEEGKSGVVVKQMEGKREVGGSTPTPDVPCRRPEAGYCRVPVELDRRQGRDGRQDGDMRQGGDKRQRVGHRLRGGRAGVERRQSIETGEETEYQGKKEDGRDAKRREQAEKREGDERVTARGMETRGTAMAHSLSE